MSDKRQEELWCHDCNNYVQFMLDYDLDGRHLLNCPKCGHEHYRIIRKGRITAERWGQDPRQQAMTTWPIVSTGYSTQSIDVWITTTSTSTGYVSY